VNIERSDSSIGRDVPTIVHATRCAEIGNIIEAKNHSEGCTVPFTLTQACPAGGEDGRFSAKWEVL
jgi:hypothetical protein